MLHFNMSTLFSFFDRLSEKPLCTRQASVNDKVIGKRCKTCIILAAILRMSVAALSEMSLDVFSYFYI